MAEENTHNNLVKDTDKNKYPNPNVIKPYTQEQIDAHAAKVGGRRNLREIPVIVDEGEYIYYYLVKKPSKTMLQAIAEIGGNSFTAQGQPIKGDPKNLTKIQQLMFGCVLAGDLDALEYDGAMYSRLIKEIGVLANQAKAELKKL